MSPSSSGGASERVRAQFACPLIEALEQAVVVCDVAGRLTLANAAARAVWGLSDDFETDGVPRGLLRFGEVDGRELVPGRDPLERALGGEQLLRERLRLIPRLGDGRLVDVSAKTLRDARGGVLGAMMTIGVVSGGPTSEELLRGYASDIEMLAEISRLLAELQDPDEAAGIICMVAIGATGASGVLLWELVDGELVMYRHEGGFAIEALTDLTDRTRTGAVRALSEARTVVERAGAERDGEVPKETVAAGSRGVPIGTVWHEPLTSGGRLTGVLSILWTGFLDDLDRPGRLIGPLAHHAATALERAELLHRLNDAARTDALTGLAMRRVWQESLDRELLRAGRESQQLSLVLIDIDHFKAYNDSFGHPQGDRLLRDAARAWSEQLRCTDLLARIGGEEFGVLLPVCPIQEARCVAERLRVSMPDEQTCSVGVVAWNGLANASKLYVTADAALYRAKENGRDRVELGRFAEQQDAPSLATH